MSQVPPSDDDRPRRRGIRTRPQRQHSTFPRTHKPSRVAQLPIAVKSNVVNLQDFIQSHDLYQELKTNASSYTVPKGESGMWVSTRHAPSDLLTELNKFRRQVPAGYRVGQYPTLACCISLSLARLEDEPALDTLAKSLQRFDDMEFASEWHRDAVWHVLSTDIVYPSRRTYSMLKAFVPTAIHQRLDETAESLGMSKGALMLYCVAFALSDQQAYVQREVLSDIRFTCNRFLYDVSTKGSVANSIMEAVKDMPGPPERVTE